MRQNLKRLSFIPKLFLNSARDKAKALAPRCLDCERPTWLSVCEICRASIQISNFSNSTNLKGIESLRSSFWFEAWAKKILWSYKERSRPIVLRPFIRKLSPAFGGLSFDAVMAVASNPILNRKRFFDPSENLAREIAKEWDLPYVPWVFERMAQPFSQKYLSASQRAEFIRYAIRLNPSKVSVWKRVLIVDDLLTTGETLKAHAALLRPFVPEVYAWTLFCVRSKLG